MTRKLAAKSTWSPKAGTAKRVYFTTSLLANWDKKGADDEQFLKAYDWDGRTLSRNSKLTSIRRNSPSSSYEVYGRVPDRLGGSRGNARAAFMIFVVQALRSITIQAFFVVALYMGAAGAPSAGEPGGLQLPAPRDL